MDVRAELKYCPVSPQKARLVIDGAKASRKSDHRSKVHA